MTAPVQTHWIPERLVQDGSRVTCEWIDVGDVRFTEPFFDMTLARSRWSRAARNSSPLQRLYEEAATAVGPAPTAFIFHVSRCGSTLLSQLLGCDAGAIVLSEVPLLDELLRSSLADREALFAAALRLIGRARSGEEHLFVKTDCWHLVYAAALRRLYPDTPFILLYRWPEAVLDSHHRSRGMHMVPGLIERAPVTVEYDPVRLSLDQYAAAMLERYYAAMVDVATDDPNTLLVSYDEGFESVFDRVASWLGLPLDAALRARIAARLAYDAKTPGTIFSPRPAEALPGVDLGRLRQLAERLDAIRRSRLA